MDVHEFWVSESGNLSLKPSASLLSSKMAAFLECFQIPVSKTLEDAIWPLRNFGTCHSSDKSWLESKSNIQWFLTAQCYKGPQLDLRNAPKSFLLIFAGASRINNYMWISSGIRYPQKLNYYFAGEYLQIFTILKFKVFIGIFWTTCNVPIT